MSDTPRSADDVMKLLDRGDTVILRKSGMGSYLAIAVRWETEASELITNAIDRCLGWDGDEDDEPDERDFGDNMPGVIETDDFLPSQVLYRLTEKATTGRIA